MTTRKTKKHPGAGGNAHLMSVLSLRWNVCADLPDRAGAASQG